MALAQPVLPATPQILQKNRGRISGKEVWRQNLNFASLAAFKIGSTLGPKGAYKLVTYRRGPEMVMKVTKDPVDVVDELGIEYPAIMTLAEAAKIQRQHIGDGISTLLVLVSALLAEADKLIEIGFHPNTILDGYLKATEKSAAIINEIATNDAKDLDEQLLKVIDGGRNLVGPKLQRHLSEAISRVVEVGLIDVNNVQIVKKPGANVLICRSKMADRISDQLSRQRIFAMHFVATDEFETAAKATGATIVGNADQLRKEDVGTARRLEIDKIKPEEISILQCD